jgi:hypothetical protein
MATETRSSSGTTSTSMEGRKALTFTAFAPGLRRTVSSRAASRAGTSGRSGSPTSAADVSSRSRCSCIRNTAGPRGVSWTLM